MAYGVWRMDRLGVFKYIEVWRIRGIWGRRATTFHRRDVGVAGAADFGHLVAQDERLRGALPGADFHRRARRGMNAPPSIDGMNAPPSIHGLRFPKSPTFHRRASRGIGARLDLPFMRTAAPRPSIYPRGEADFVSSGLTGGELGIGARPRERTAGDGRERTAGDGSGGLTGAELVGDWGRGSRSGLREQERTAYAGAGADCGRGSGAAEPKRCGRLQSTHKSSRDLKYFSYVYLK
jgi:hypothetical protein